MITQEKTVLDVARRPLVRLAKSESSGVVMVVYLGSIAKNKETIRLRRARRNPRRIGLGEPLQEWMRTQGDKSAKKDGQVGDRTQDLPQAREHAKRTRYHCATCPIY